MYFSQARAQSQFTVQPAPSDSSTVPCASASFTRPSSAIQKNLFNFSIYYADRSQLQGHSPALAASSQILANGAPSSTSQQLPLVGREGESNGVRTLMQHSAHKFKPINTQLNGPKHFGSKSDGIGNNPKNLGRRSVTRIKLVGFSGDPEFQQMKDTSTKIVEATEGMLQLKMDEIKSEIDYDLRLKQLKRSSSAFLPAYKAFKDSSSNGSYTNNTQPVQLNGQATPVVNNPAQLAATLQSQQRFQNKRPFYFLTEKNEPLFSLKQLQDKIPLQQQANMIIEMTEESKQLQLHQQMQLNIQQSRSSTTSTSEFLTATATPTMSTSDGNNSNGVTNKLVLNNINGLLSAGSAKSSFSNLNSSTYSTTFNGSSINSSNSLIGFNQLKNGLGLTEDFGDKKYVYLSIKTSQKNSSRESPGSFFFPQSQSSQSENAAGGSSSKNGSPNQKLAANASTVTSFSSLPQLGLASSDNFSSITSNNLANSNSNAPSLAWPNTSTFSSTTSSQSLNYNNGESFKLIIELYTKIAPKACENFLQFCEGFLDETGTYLTFRETQALRVKKNGFIQMGLAKPGISIYNGYFEDESFAVTHDKPGIIGYCNRGSPHSNSSQFYITLAEMKSFDKKMVAFGRVISGFNHLEKINKIMVKQSSEIPPFNITIFQSGVLQSRPSTNQSRKSNSSIPTRTDLLAISEQDHIIDDESQRVIRPDIFYYRGEKQTKIQTYENYVISEAEKHKEVAASEYISLMLAVQSIAFGCTEILKYAYKYKDIDTIKNSMKDVFVNCLSDCQSVALLYDTKDDEVFIESNQGKFVVAFTSLDVDNLADLSSCGSLLLIYRKTTTSFRPAKRSDLLQSGEAIYGAGYIMYGQSTQIVFHTGYRLNGFTLDPEANFFILTHPRIKATKNGGIISCDESKLLDGNISKFIRRRKILNDSYVSRYVGSRVSDFHRTLIYGGILIYPQKEVNIYEAFCLSYLIDKAWDRSSCGQEGQVLIKKPLDLTDKIQLYIGYSQDVLEIDNLYLSIRRKNSLYKIHDVPSQKQIKVSSYSTHKSTMNSPTKTTSQQQQ